MEFYEVLKNRHSIRQFVDKPVEPEKLKRILDAIQSAPSAGNLQAYKIYITQSQETKSALSEASMGQPSVSGASAVLVFCADKARSSSKYQELGEELFSIQDATIAAAYAQLAATSEGLSSVWIGAFDPLEVSRVVNAEPYHVPVALIPIGYAGQDIRKTSRRPDDEMISEV